MQCNNQNSITLIQTASISLDLIIWSNIHVPTNIVNDCTSPMHEIILSDTPHSRWWLTIMSIHNTINTIMFHNNLLWCGKIKIIIIHDANDPSCLFTASQDMIDRKTLSLIPAPYLKGVKETGFLGPRNLHSKGSHETFNHRLRAGVGLRLGQYLRCWPSLQPTLGDHLS